MTSVLFWKMALIFEAGFLVGLLFALFWVARAHPRDDDTVVMIALVPDAPTAPSASRPPRPLGTLRPESLN